MKIQDLRIGDIVTFCAPPSIPMRVVGLFENTIGKSTGTVYLDFEGNEGDVWEEEVENVKKVEQ